MGTLALLAVLGLLPDVCSLVDDNGRSYCARVSFCPPACDDGGGRCPKEVPQVCCDPATGACWSVSLAAACEYDLGSCSWGITWEDGTVTCFDQLLEGCG